MLCGVLPITTSAAAVLPGSDRAVDPAPISTPTPSPRLRSADFSMLWNDVKEDISQTAQGIANQVRWSGDKIKNDIEKKLNADLDRDGTIGGPNAVNRIDRDPNGGSVFDPRRPRQD
ncbi:hypothetical protein PINS_up016948 [Pythium insidiosum]|nr:hypothetical protein PINS_up016948 [Pythium insidiosum]